MSTKDAPDNKNPGTSAESDTNTHQQVTFQTFQSAPEQSDGRQQSALLWDDVDEQSCQNCGAQVSAQFRRTHGDSDDVAHACPECAPKTELRRLAHDPDAVPGGGRQ